MSAEVGSSNRNSLPVSETHPARLCRGGIFSFQTSRASENSRFGTSAVWSSSLVPPAAVSRPAANRFPSRSPPPGYEGDFQRGVLRHEHRSPIRHPDLRIDHKE